MLWESCSRTLSQNVEGQHKQQKSGLYIAQQVDVDIVSRTIKRWVTPSCLKKFLIKCHARQMYSMPYYTSKYHAFVTIKAGKNRKTGKINLLVCIFTLLWVSLFMCMPLWSYFFRLIDVSLNYLFIKIVHITLKWIWDLFKNLRNCRLSTAELPQSNVHNIVTSSVFTAFIFCLH